MVHFAEVGGEVEEQLGPAAEAHQLPIAGAHRRLAPEAPEWGVVGIGGFVASEEPHQSDAIPLRIVRVVCGFQERAYPCMRWFNGFSGRAVRI